MLGKTIYELRKQRGLTLSELAKRSKISKSYLSSIERNLNLNPSIQVVNRIAKVLEVELDAFLNPVKSSAVQQDIDQDLIDFATELKETGVKTGQIKEYRTLIDYINWKVSKVEKD